MSLQVMSDHAGQVIIGEVASIESYWGENPKQIESKVTLVHVEYLKGALSDSTDEFTLVVPGGMVGETQMRLGCAPDFGPGEKWLLFLLPAYKTFPTVGISQGAMRIETDATGVDRVLSASGRRIVGIDDEGYARVSRTEATSISTGRSKLIHSTSADVVLVRSDAMQAMSLDEFRGQLQPILDRSTQHDLTVPSARRIPVRYTPVPLIRTIDSHLISGDTGESLRTDRKITAPLVTAKTHTHTFIQPVHQKATVSDSLANP